MSTKPHILIIEDDRWLAEMDRDVLASEFTITICHEAQAAIESLDKGAVDLILLDLMLPGGNGLTFLQELRSYDDTASVPVVVCSAARFSKEQHLSIEQFAPIYILDKGELTPKRLRGLVQKAMYATKH